jgi:hypothetical protein
LVKERNWDKITALSQEAMRIAKAASGSFLGGKKQ